MAVWVFAGGVTCAEPAPQYIVFNIAPGHTWDQRRPESFTRAAFDEVSGAFKASDNPNLKIGLSFLFSTLERPTNILAESVLRFLNLGKETGVPVLVALDGQNWWQTRPDLWNWWDPKQPGFNPSNVYNVEWTNWGPAHAVKVCWRNWGQQFRVAPAQNLASRRVMEEHLKPLRVLAPIIANWARSLPPSQRWLFAGLKLGSEAGIGYNAYHYPDGNSYLERWPGDSSHDPTNSLVMSKGLSGGVMQLGYAAVSTAGLKREGQITRDDLAVVTARYLEELCRVAADAGLPPEQVFTHQGGNYAPWTKHAPFWPAFNRWSTPGWSFYGVDPHHAGTLAAEMEKAGRRPWAASEWWWGGHDAVAWEENFRRTLSFKDCRFICVYNWNQGMFEREKGGQEAVRKLVGEWRKTGR